MTCLRLTFIVFMITIGTVKGRWLELEPGSTGSMISDGIHDVNPENTLDHLRMGASNYSVSTTMLYGEKRCESIYGFLPCADTMSEGVFLMIMYTYMIMLGEDWIHKGSQTLFLLLLGDVVFGASVFRVLMALPRIVLVIVGGVGSAKSAAQYQVAFGLSIYAGSTLITLTFIWGLCIILNKDKLRKEESIQGDEQQLDSSKRLPHKHILSILKDDGVKLDDKTGEMVVTMLLSLVPFTTIGLVALIKSPTMILLSLVVSFVSLAIYFAYQIWNPWVQARSLAYLKEEKLQIRFFYHIQKLANDKLVDENGKTNTESLKRVFYRADEDYDRRITHAELENLIKKFDLEKDNISDDYAKTEITRQFDDDSSGRINREEFIRGCTKWLEKWKEDNNSFNNSHFKNLWQQVDEIENLNKREIEKIMSRILSHYANHELVKENEEDDKKRIKDLLFSQYLPNGDDIIDQDGLQKFIAGVDFGASMDKETIFKKIERDFHQNGNHKIMRKDEFVNWFSKWIDKAVNYDPTIKDPKQAITKFDEADEKEILNRCEIEKIMSRILKHGIGKHELVKENGEADKQKIKELFSPYFKINDNVIHEEELLNFIASVDFGVLCLDDKTILKNIVSDFHQNSNHETMRKDEFVNWFGKWIDKAIKHDPDIKDPKQAITKFDEVVETEIPNKCDIEKIMSRILKHGIEKHELVNENGEADKQKIKELFSPYFQINDSVIHQDELHNFIASVDFGASWDPEKIFKNIERDYHKNGNHKTMEKDEFVNWFYNWIDKAMKHDPSIKDPKEAIENFDKNSWAKINTPIYMLIPLGSIVYLVAGIAVMLMISGAFMQSIQQFSNAANIPLHLTSFVVIPFVMNARIAVTSFLRVGPRVSKNASLIFSELYNGLVMNNLLGLFTLLAIVYLKGLSWTYSKEVVTIMLPCAVVGLFALRRKTYPLWASILAILLYPIYGYLYYVLGS